MKAVLLLAPFAALACSPLPADRPAKPTMEPQLRSIEIAAGERLGVALVDRHGRLRTGHRSDERFAFCSTFKLLLAGMILDGAGDAKWNLDEQLQLTNADLVFHSPVTEQHVDQGSIRIREAAEAIVVVSDNAAANLLLKRVGGIPAFNRWLRAHGDRATRLDRLEPALNENLPGDPRDTSTPRQIATSAAHLLFGDRLRADEQRLLRQWLVGSRTGLDRIRAGLPSDMVSGDKTGTCGGKGRESFNDVAFILPSAGSDDGYVLAVYLDRPNAAPANSNAAIARVATSVVPLIQR